MLCSGRLRVGRAPSGDIQRRESEAVGHFRATYLTRVFGGVKQAQVSLWRNCRSIRTSAPGRSLQVSRQDRKRALCVGRGRREGGGSAVRGTAEWKRGGRVMEWPRQRRQLRMRKYVRPLYQRMTVQVYLLDETGGHIARLTKRVARRHTEGNRQTCRVDAKTQNNTRRELMRSVSP